MAKRRAEEERKQEKMTAADREIAFSNAAAMAIHTSRRARHTYQKRQIVENLLVLWIEYPEQRLGQLIGNVLGSSEPLFYVEDLDLDERLNEFRERHSKY